MIAVEKLLWLSFVLIQHAYISQRQHETDEGPLSKRLQRVGPPKWVRHFTGDRRGKSKEPSFPTRVPRQASIRTVAIDSRCWRNNPIPEVKVSCCPLVHELVKKDRDSPVVPFTHEHKVLWSAHANFGRAVARAFSKPLLNYLSVE